MASRTQQEKVEKKKSTIQTDFAIGEQVLCYEPDTSKAKMLYEARILEVDVTKDDKGKKVPEYFIHFIGWNKSWDRWVLTDSVLKDSETSRQLQKKLYEKAVGNKKRSRYQRQKQEVENDEVETASQSNQSTANSSHAEGELSNELPFVSIDIPTILKSKLEDDCYYIKRKKKLLKLPRNPSALQILREYLKFCEIRESNDNCISTPSGKTINIDIVREVVEGLQTYLNFTLSTLLLYNFEKEQYEELFSNTYVSKVQKNPVSDPPKIQEETVLLQQQPTVPESRKLPSKRKSTRRNKPKHDEDETSESRSSNQAAESAVPQVADSNGSIIMHPPQRKRGRPSRKSKLELLAAQKPIPRRETRATGHILEKQNDEQPIIEVTDVLEEQSKRICTHTDPIQTDEKLVELEKRSTSIPDIIDKEEDSSKLDGKAIEEKSDKLLENETSLQADNESSTRALRPRRPLFLHNALKMNFNDYGVDHCTLPIGASARSIEKSNINANFEEGDKKHLYDFGSSYLRFPLSKIDSKSPAEIYGVEHLLRLFVKLPTILARSELDSRKRSLLTDHLEMFLRYLAERANGLFDKDNYSESVI